MSIGELVLTAVTLVLSLAASWALLMPFFKEPEAPAGRDDDLRLEDMQMRKSMVLQALEDLEHELTGGRITKDQYHATKTELTREAAEYIAEIDRLEDKRAREQDGNGVHRDL